MGLHHRDNHGWGIPVHHIIDRIAAEGLPIRLAWPSGDISAPVGWSTDDCPTGYLPRIGEESPAPWQARTTA
ncbi:hypothetical protein [Gandjariella thermophila]|uniref:Uncharacterized protein n=1 Tax=Gandjariella thermophila TaxID=1931992 RepID=A0A4D4J821_9PSEU|nr:hypothetical protein [Gandjariella thermophila]GDY31664.1 hypothetical protein GTS_32970 [Gandjariella thermophila]